MQTRPEKLSAWDVVHAVNLAITTFITYVLITSITPLLAQKPAQPVGILWAVISAVFVFRDTREHSLSAGISRLFATCVSFALCLVYLLLFPANPLGMAILIAIGALLATAVPASCGYGRRRHGWYWLQMDRVVFVFSCQRTRGELAIGS